MDLHGHYFGLQDESLKCVLKLSLCFPLRVFFRPFSDSSLVSYIKCQFDT